MKTNKSFSKRIKVTKTGKLLRRSVGQNHFNAKESGEKQLKKGALKSLSMKQRTRRRFLPSR